MFVNLLYLLVLCFMQQDCYALAHKNTQPTLDLDDVEELTPSPTTTAPVRTDGNLAKSVANMLTTFLKLTRPGVKPSSTQLIEDVSSILRYEFFTIATGNHLIFPESDSETEKTQRKHAAAVSALWSDLFIMDDMDEILKNVSVEVAKNFVTQFNAGNNIVQSLMKLLFTDIQKSISEDTFLDVMFLAEQIRYVNRILPILDGSPKEHKTYVDIDSGSDDVSEKVVAEWLNHPEIRKFLVNKLFLQHRYKPNNGAKSLQNERYVLTRALLNLAHERCCMEPSQKIYTETVSEVAENFVLADYPSKTVQQLFTKLEKKLESDDKLKTEFEKAKKKVTDQLVPTTELPKATRKRSVILDNI